MTWQPATTNPTVSGWYAVLIEHSDRPLVLWWSATWSERWLHGARRVNARAWVGPFLPSPGEALP